MIFSLLVQLFEYRRLVQLLLRLIKGRGDGDDFVRRIAIYLLNSLACQVDGEQKELVGDLGAIEVSHFGSSTQKALYLRGSSGGILFISEF